MTGMPIVYQVGLSGCTVRRFEGLLVGCMIVCEGLYLAMEIPLEGGFIGLREIG